MAPITCCSTFSPETDRYHRYYNSPSHINPHRLHAWNNNTTFKRKNRPGLTPIKMWKYDADHVWLLNKHEIHLSLVYLIYKFVDFFDSYLFSTNSRFFYCQDFSWHLVLTDTDKNVQKWTRVFSTRRWVILVARKKREEKSVSTFGRFRLWTSLESSPVSVNIGQILSSSF